MSSVDARLVAFVVDVDRPARLEERRVVDHAAQLARDDVADLAGVVARAAAVEVRLEPVTHGFVEEDPAVARREHDLHRPRRRLLRVEHPDRLLGRVLRVLLGRVPVEVAERRAPAAARAALLPLTVLLGDRADAEAEERLRVAGHLPVARGDEDFANFFREARLDLDDARVERVRRRRRALEELALLDAWLVDRDRRQLVPTRQGQDAHRRRLARAAARDLRGRLGCVLHRVPIELLDVRVARRVALLHADAEPHRDAARGALQDPFVEDEPTGGAVLEEEIGVVAAFRQRDREQTLGELRVDLVVAADAERRAVEFRTTGSIHRRASAGPGNHGVRTLEPHRNSSKRAWFPMLQIPCFPPRSSSST